ncbi:NodS-like protein [Defluviimonas sp. 20V17]|uniref:Methyltransferase domain-containing protein n=1 Tax=Allgaiera indica TaxID=765699 RepID=A0AAN4ZXB5_9RHOB|nr:class I SAM-dependent methyltransferase [Allgaiera indica]KDB05720.1 NodS-like protein [Defluviimonas sp. 20V17]GHD98490.1 hypothetical protein GCM10008024_02210 [Allgaiera indica]SDW12613.1 Methyltransferase domain-containing protein [Allgaiera indica]
MTETKQDHWNRIYSRKAETELSWHQDDPARSLDLVAEAGLTPDQSVIDIGGGTSRVTDGLLERGLRDLTVLDLSEAALDRLRQRLGPRGQDVAWIAADITTWAPGRVYDLWHDRAVFHFLVTPEDRAAYLERLSQALRLDGHAIIATFAPDGPETCSGLPVERYSPQSLAQTLGPDYRLLTHRLERHQTPGGVVQSFQFSLFRKIR